MKFIVCNECFSIGIMFIVFDNIFQIIIKFYSGISKNSKPKNQKTNVSQIKYQRSNCPE